MREPAWRAWAWASTGPGTTGTRPGPCTGPRSVEQLQELVARAANVRVLGSRHSFNDIADADELISLEGLPDDVVIDPDAGTVSFAAGLRYGELVDRLAAARLALHNLASLPHISVAGAVATATHGSGVGNGNLATAVAGLELVTSSGELVRFSRGDPDFDGLVVGLGALGAVTRISLDVEPAYEVRQRVFEGLRWEALAEHFDEIMGCGYSVSVFTRWLETVDQVWVKSRLDQPERTGTDLFGARPATGRPPSDPRDRCGAGHAPARPPRTLARPAPALPDGVHPERGRGVAVGVPAPSTARRARHRGRPGARRPHPAAPARHRDPYGRRRPAVDEHELRRRLGRPPLHLAPAARAGGGAPRRPGAGARPVRGPPALGQGVPRRRGSIAPRYERYADFVALVDRLDPRGAFRNRWLQRSVLDAAGEPPAA